MSPVNNFGRSLVFATKFDIDFLIKLSEAGLLKVSVWEAPYLTGENLTVLWAKFSTLS